MNNPYKNMVDSGYIGVELSYKKHLCSLLNLEYKCGNMRELQFKTLSRYMDLERRKGKVIINKIYNDEYVVQNITKGRYTKYIEDFLVIMLCQITKENKTPSIVMTNKDILEATHMVNDKYFKGMNGVFTDKTENEEGVKLLLKRDKVFFSVTYRLLKRIIYDALVSMEKNTKTIVLNKTYVCFNNKSKGLKQHDCTDLEISRILSVESKTLRQFNDMMMNDAIDRYGLDLDKSKVFQLYNLGSVHTLDYTLHREFKSMLMDNFRGEFKNEGYDTYTKAHKIILADHIAFEHELNKRMANAKGLNDNIVNKMNNAKGLQTLGDALPILVEEFVKIT